LTEKKTAFAEWELTVTVSKDHGVYVEEGEADALLDGLVREAEILGLVVGGGIIPCDETFSALENDLVRKSDALDKIASLVQSCDDLRDGWFTILEIVKQLYGEDA